MPNALQNLTKKWLWTAPRSRAARLVAEDELTDEEIAADIKVSRQTIATWKRHPTFAARVDELVDQISAVQARFAIAKRSRRIAALDSRWRGMQQVITERAGALHMQGVPGGSTGLLVRTLRSVGSGDLQEVVEEFEVDTGLLRELREHEKQAAQELGQWSERHEVAAVVVKVLRGVSMADL